ncbi:unnamed protein product [Adineta steineri]|uniref:Uncharacterized protein n=1 Tax=Adineta steineri TaxID=433720 RepID=A0A813ZCS7_9BILA|nr:unnamed protein product [Adineta steineri]CAF3866716.1 unnamed protein product [Adineta steineri]
MDKKSSRTFTSDESSSTRSHRSRNAQTFQNYHLVWLYEGIDDLSNDIYSNAIIKLHGVVNTINTFTDVDECINFITDDEEKKIVMIIPGSLCQTIVPIVQDIPQVHCVYIYSEDKEKYEKCIEGWYKVQLVFTDIIKFCETLKQTAQDCIQDLVSISFIEKDEILNSDLDTLDSSFMYSKILKEILLTIDFKQEHIDEFLKFYRERPVCDPDELMTIKELSEKYNQYRPIWWYTKSGTLCSMINRGLREMQVDFIIKSGFFIRDLQNDIVALHSQQYTVEQGSNSFTVYRGQALSQKDFDKLNSTQGGLISFNNFLSTSFDEDVAILFAESAKNDTYQLSVVFKIIIDPSKSSSPFANVTEISPYREREILFSIHSVFRIGRIKQIEGYECLWEVDLTSTCDTDPQLYALTKRIQEETASDYSGWYRLGQLMIQLGQFDKANELYEKLLTQTTDSSEQGHLYYQLGSVKMYQGEYVKAIKFYEDTLEIHNNVVPLYNNEVAGSYNSIGLAYDNMGESTKALSYYEKAEKIARETLPEDDPRLYSFNNNIGSVYSKMGEYRKALSYYEKAHEFLQKTLPANHINFATFYNNTGWIYNKMGEYTNALTQYEKAHEILRKTLPSNHLQLAVSYNSLGSIYDEMCEYSKALEYYKKVLEIVEITLPNHPLLTVTYNNIGVAYKNMGELSQSLLYLEQAFEIRQKTLPADHPDLASSYNNIGAVYQNMNKHSESLTYLEKALEIRQAVLPAKHPSLASTYNSIGNAYYFTNEYSKALSYYERALNIYQHSSSPHHPAIEKIKGSIAAVKNKL